MADHRLRELERRWKETGLLAHGDALFYEMLRQGQPNYVASETVWGRKETHILAWRHPKTGKVHAISDGKSRTLQIAGRVIRADPKRRLFVCTSTPGKKKDRVDLISLIHPRVIWSSIDEISCKVCTDVLCNAEILWLWRSDPIGEPSGRGTLWQLMQEKYKSRLVSFKALQMQTLMRLVSADPVAS